MAKIIYEIWGVKEGREKDQYFSAKATPEEAVKIQKKWQDHFGREGYGHYHDAIVIRPKEIDTDFEIPSRPTPRETYGTRVLNQPKENGWPGVMVSITKDNDQEVVYTYERNYAMLDTFEPFRRGDRNFALISPHYTGTSVLDLDQGEIIAAEPVESNGFCPVGFYVPDWWDVHDGSIIPGSEYWDEDNEWPVGDFGFVWGCHWGDDSSWKVQYLDLANIQDGVLNRDDRFGYLALATEAGNPKDFIRVWSDSKRVTMAVEEHFDLETGQRVGE